MSTARSTSRIPRLVVVPADPLALYEEKGRGALLRDYYNPGGLFEQVTVLSPRETGIRRVHGMTVEGVGERDFRRRLRELRPDVVRAYGGGWAADLCARLRIGDIPVVASVHNTDHRVRPALRYLDRVFCVSDAVARRVRAVGVEPSRIRLLPNRIDRSVFRPRDDLAEREALQRRFPPGRRVLLVGRAAPQKNRDTLIRALRHLPDDYLLIAVGQGDLDADRALARSEGVEERLHLVPSVPNDELPHWYGWADCVCNPSRWEGFGIVFVEAAACGAAIVTSDLPVTRELFRHERDALLVEHFEDPRAVAHEVRRACEDPELRERLRRNAPAVAEPFSKQAVDAREVSLYREVVAAGGPGPARRLPISIWQTWHGETPRAARRRLRSGWQRLRSAWPPLAKARSMLAAGAARSEALPGGRLSQAIRRIGGSDEEPARVWCQRPVFVLSAGWRCGSTLLQRLIASDGETLVWGEPFGDHVPVHRMAQMLEPFASQDLHSPNAIDRFAGDLSAQWIANLNPGLPALRRAHLAWFEELFAAPARSRGFRRWGCKWVRLGASHADYLRWLYPDCKLVFLVRDPLEAWRSYRSQGADWYLARPDGKIDTPVSFLRHWEEVAGSFLAEHERLGALLVRYEDLVGDAGATKALADHLGSRIDAEVLGSRLGGQTRRPTRDRLARLLCATRYRALRSRLGYTP